MFTSAHTHLLELIKPLCAPLHEEIASAAEDVAAVRELLDIRGRDYAWAGTHLIRAVMQRRLASRDLGGWTVTGRVANNGPVWLYRGFTTLRVLHDGPFDPAPGKNVSRREYFQNTPLFTLPEQLVIPAAEESKYLAVWRVRDPVTFEIGIDVLRPIGIWNYGAAARVDLLFSLPSTDERLDELAFTPSDNEILFELPSEGEASDEPGMRG